MKIEELKKVSLVSFFSGMSEDSVLPVHQLL